MTGFDKNQLLCTQQQDHHLIAVHNDEHFRQVLVLKVTLATIYCGLFLRLGRRPQVLRLSLNASISPGQVITYKLTTLFIYLNFVLVDKQ